MTMFLFMFYHGVSNIVCQKKVLSLLIEVFSNPIACGGRGGGAEARVAKFMGVIQKPLTPTSRNFVT